MNTIKKQDENIILLYAEQQVKVLLETNPYIGRSSDEPIFIMCGHFAAVLDLEKNRVYPGITGSFPDRLNGFLKSLQMSTFPLVTFRVGACMVSLLKKRGYFAQICVLANDTMGITGIRDHECNRLEKKTSLDYEQELFRDFYSSSLFPARYLEVLDHYGLSLEMDVARDTFEVQEPNGKKRTKSLYCFSEQRLLKQFQKLVRKNKSIFKGKIEYDHRDLRNVKVDNGLFQDPDLLLTHFPQGSLKSCSLRSSTQVHLETGGNRCSVEVAGLALSLLGGSGILDYCSYIPRSFSHKKINSGLLFLVVPAACDKAVSRGCSLYNEVFQFEGGVRMQHLEMHSNPIHEMRLLMSELI